MSRVWDGAGLHNLGYTTSRAELKEGWPWRAYLGPGAGVLEKVYFAEVVGKGDDLTVVRPYKGVNVCAIRSFRPHTCRERETEDFYTQTHTHTHTHR